MIDEIVTCTTERYRSCAKGKGEFFMIRVVTKISKLARLMSSETKWY